MLRGAGGERGAEIGHVIERPSHDKVGLVNRQVVVVTGASHLLVTVLLGGGGGGRTDPRGCCKRGTGVLPVLVLGSLARNWMRPSLFGWDFSCAIVFFSAGEEEESVW